MRDEAHNLPKQISAINSLIQPIHTWVICENGSTDGTRQLLIDLTDKIKVENLLIVNLDTESQEYALGFKYSRIVSHGFSLITSRLGQDFDYIGILDADCFPEPDYYLKLCEEFEKDQNLGILSGVLVDENGRRHPGSSDFPRGNCRLWRRECFFDAGYIVGMSADALSTAKALARNWKCRGTSNAIVETREVGARAGQSYYGQSAYYRGETAVYSALRAATIAKRSPSDAWDYFRGYFLSMLQRAPQTSDPDVLNYSRSKMSQKFTNAFRLVK